MSILSGICLDYIYFKRTKGGIIMKLKQSVKLLLSLLFLLVSQSYAVHSGQHALEKVEECHACQSFNHIDTKHHEIHLPSFFVSYNAESFEVVQCSIVNQPVDLEQHVVQKQIDLNGMKYLEVYSVPLGFDTTAPPKNS